jgi:predicted dehydrogenase
MSEGKAISRRNFLEKSSAVAAGVYAGIAGSTAGCDKKSAPSVVRPYHKVGDTVRVGLIGTGSRGCWLLRNLIKAPDCKVTDVCDDLDFHLEAGVEIAGEGVRAHSDYRKLLERQDLDAVVIASPPYLHAVMTLDAIEADKHILCEKTLCFSIEENNRVIRAARGSKNIFAVGQQRRWSPIYQKAMEIIAEGAIGRITQFRAQWHRNNNWRRPVPDPALERKINWRMYREYSAGLMAELGTHQIDVANWVLDEAHPLAVTGFGGVNYWDDGRETFDNVSLVYKYPDGVKGIYTSLLSNEKMGYSEQVLGDKGTLEIDMAGGLFFKEKKALTEEEAKEHGTDTSRELQKQILVTGATLRPETEDVSKGEQFTQGGDDPTYLMLADFIQCIKEDRKPAGDFEVGARASIAILMANQAMREERIVRWKDDWMT